MSPHERFFSTVPVTNIRSVPVNFKSSYLKIINLLIDLCIANQTAIRIVIIVTNPKERHPFKTPQELRNCPGERKALL